MRFVLLAGLALATGCVTAPAVSPGMRVAPETRPDCEARCQEMGMRLGAVVLIRNSAGCVCEPEGSAPRAAGASGIAGGTAIAVDEERAREESARREDEARRASRE